MATTVTGMAALERRLKAIGDTKAQLRAIQLAAIAEAKARVPRKTGHLAASIQPGRVTNDYAIVQAHSNYARYVEEGTGIYGPRKQKIVPKKANVLAWRTGATRLSGRSRTKGGTELAGWAFARSVKGRKATPYLIPGAKAAVKKGGFKDAIITRWNRAA